MDAVIDTEGVTNAVMDQVGVQVGVLEMDMEGDGDALSEKDSATTDLYVSDMVGEVEDVNE